jgi:uncharacterized protein (DUF305 family)
MTVTNWTLSLALAAALAGTQAHAQQRDSSRHDMSMPSTTVQGRHQAADTDMMTSMTKMNHDMTAVPMTGNPDRDFVAMMIPHHQGAIDMAGFELRHGKDPAIRGLARNIVAAQKKEIATMQRWLSAHAKR